METFIDYGALEGCQKLESSFGEICVQCNKCGRFKKPTKKEAEKAKRKREEAEAEINRLFAEAFPEDSF